MITHLFDPSHLLAQGQAVLQDNGSMVVWSPMDAAVSVLFNFIHKGLNDRDQIIAAACQVQQIDELIARRMLRLLCGNKPNWYLWRYERASGLALWA